MQRHAVVAVTVLAHVDQATQPALQQRQLPQLLAYRAELGLSRADDVVGGPGLRGTQQVTDFPEGEPEPRGPADEGQPPLVILGVLPETGAQALGHSQQSPALIEPHGLDADPLGGSKLPDRQPSHVPKTNSRTPVRSQPAHWMGAAASGPGAWAA